MRRFSLIALLLAAVFLSCTCVTGSSLGAGIPSLRRHAGRSNVEWNVDEETGALSMHAYTSGEHGAPVSQLVTFEADATVATLMESPLVIDLAADHMHHASAQCSMRVGESEVDSSRSLVDALQSDRWLELICTGRSRQHAGAIESSWNFVKFRRHKFAPDAVREFNAKQRAETGELQPYPLESTELLAENWAGISGWVESFLESHWGPIHPVNTYVNSSTQTGRWHLNTGAVLQPGDSFGSESDSVVRLAIAADWGAGTLESDCVQSAMMAGNGTEYKPHWTLHVGDIYYVGQASAVQSNCLGQAPEGVAKGVTWPHGSIGSFAVQGNHEMYSRGYGFFDTFLPTLGTNDAKGNAQGQQAGYVAMENKYWRVIMLDTGYNTYSMEAKLDNSNNTQPQEIIDWLRDVVQIGNASDHRGLIFFTHHQVVSAFGGESLATPWQIAELLPANKTVIWLWGHEHRVAWYELQQIANAVQPVNFYGRCIGNSGFPSSTSPIPTRAKEAGLRAYDDRAYMVDSGLFNITVSFNGWIHIDLEQETATILYSSLALDPSTGILSPSLQIDLVSEKFEVDAEGNVSLIEFDVLDPAITIVQSEEDEE